MSVIATKAAYEQLHKYMGIFQSHNKDIIPAITPDITSKDRYTARALLFDHESESHLSEEFYHDYDEVVAKTRLNNVMLLVLFATCLPDCWFVFKERISQALITKIRHLSVTWNKNHVITKR